MISVDVVCESENLPRIRLLRTHMRQLQIVLNICEEVPPVHTERIIYVPRRRDSAFSHTPSSPNYERIALYLDERTEPIDAEMKVNLATWPGRSSDKPNMKYFKLHENHQPKHYSCSRLFFLLATIGCYLTNSKTFL